MAEFSLETERLVLRQWSEGDRAAFAALNADPQVMEHLDGSIDRAASDALQDRLAGWQNDSGHTYWAIERKADGAMIGFCGIGPGRHEGTSVGQDRDLGWRLARHAWGQGYAREAAEATVAWAWEHLPVTRLLAWTVPANLRSWGLMVRIGMQRRAGLDFGHPAFPAGHPLRQHIVYAIDRPQ